MLSNRLHTYYSACVSEVIWNVQGLGFFVGGLLLLLLLLVLFTCKYEEFCDFITPLLVGRRMSLYRKLLGLLYQRFTNSADE